MALNTYCFWEWQKNKLFEIIETVGMGYLHAQYGKRRSSERLYFHNLFSKSRT
jgi:hypothetical protein